MAVRYYLGPLAWVAAVEEDKVTRFVPLEDVPLFVGRVSLGSPLLTVFTPGERVTILKQNAALPGMDRLAIHRYEASAARIALADTHPLLIPLPQDKEGRWSDSALSALERSGITRGQAQTSTKEVAQLMLANQRGKPFDERDRTSIVMAGEVV